MGLFSGSWEQPKGWNELYNSIMGQYRSGQAPGFITEPIKQEGEREQALIRKLFSSVPYGNLSGLQSAQMMKSEAGTKRALGQAGGQYGYGLLSALQNLMNMQQRQPSGVERFADIIF